MFNSIKIRSIFIICLFIFFALAIVNGVFIIFSIRGSLEDSLINRSKSEVAAVIRSQAVRRIPKEVFSESDVIKTQDVFNPFFNEIDTDEILRIKVWDRNARIISANDPSIIGLKFPDNKMFQEAIKGTVVGEIQTPISPENIKEHGYGQLMEIYVPIIYPDGKVAGIIETYTILDSLNLQIRNAQNALIAKIIVVFVPTLIFLGVLFLIFYQNLISRIKALVRFTEVLGGGNFKELIPVKSNDEISELAAAINKMAGDLNVSVVSKNELKDQIIMATAEIQKKIDELEKRSRLMVGREQKMIELKKEIAKLKGLSGGDNK
jgi:methyl-accepting chemotaxis protein